MACLHVFMVEVFTLDSMPYLISIISHNVMLLIHANTASLGSSKASSRNIVVFVCECSLVYLCPVHFSDTSAMFIPLSLECHTIDDLCGYHWGVEDFIAKR